MEADVVGAMAIFGATGDLAGLETFPALVGLVERGMLDVPVVWVAMSGWDLAQFRQYAADSLRDNGFDLHSPAVEKLLELLRYVDGDLTADTTCKAMSEEMGGGRALFYLEAPPSLFGRIALGIAAAGRADGARIVVEKPFGTDLQSARELNKTLSEVFPVDTRHAAEHPGTPRSRAPAARPDGHQPRGPGPGRRTSAGRPHLRGTRADRLRRGQRRHPTGAWHLLEPHRRTARARGRRCSRARAQSRRKRSSLGTSSFWTARTPSTPHEWQVRCEDRAGCRKVVLAQHKRRQPSRRGWAIRLLRQCCDVGERPPAPCRTPSLSIRSARRLRSHRPGTRRTRIRQATAWSRCFGQD